MANIFGKAMANNATKNKVATATNAANGGVAIATKMGTPAKKQMELRKRPYYAIKGGGRKSSTHWTLAPNT